MTTITALAFGLTDLISLVGDDLDDLLNEVIAETLPYECECGQRTDEAGADWDWHGHRCSPECAPRCGDCWSDHLNDGGRCYDED